MKIITKLLSILSSFRIFHCNCCGRVFSPCYKNSWGDFVCLSCGSSIRSRLLLACLQYIDDLSYIQLVWNKCILHCAPEKPTIKYLSAHSGSYVKADYSVSRYKDSKFIDLNVKNLDYPDGSFDCVISLDVLEHVPSTANALREIFRLLKNGGCFISSVPIPFGSTLTTEATLEQQSDPKILKRLFGIPDHQRMFGSDYQLALQRYFSEVRVINSSDFLPTIQRRHLLNSNSEILKPLATRDRRIFFAYKK